MQCFGNIGGSCNNQKACEHIGSLLGEELPAMKMTPLASLISHSLLQFIFPRSKMGDTISIPSKKIL